MKSSSQIHRQSPILFMYRTQKRIQSEVHPFYNIRWASTTRKCQTQNEDPKDGILKSLQITQNKAARFLNGNKLQDHVPTKQTFDDLDLLSVNQLNAQIKIREVWKSLNDNMHPIQWEKRSADQSTSCNLRSALSKALKPIGKSRIVESTFMSDAVKVWNATPQCIQECKSLFTVKKEINKFVRSLPLKMIHEFLLTWLSKPCYPYFMFPK